MNKILFLLTLFLVSCSLSINTKMNKVKRPLNCYKVIKIDSINNWYLIYANKNDSLYKIVSKKELKSNCEKIKVNNCYEMNLNSFLDKAIAENKNSIPQNLYDIRCWDFDDSTSICLESDSIYDLYLTDNIKGICLSKE